MSATPWFKFYPGDYKSDTGRLTTVQHGAYILLLLDYYATGEAPPNDDVVLAKITLCDSQNEWFAIRKAIARHFEITDVWKHERCEKELLARSAEHTKKSEAGKKGNEIKWGVSQSGSQNSGSAIRKSIAIPEVRSQKSEVIDQNLEVRGQKSEPKESKSKELRETRLIIPPIQIPDWIPVDAWNDFVDSRKKLRKPLTQGAIKLAISTLSKLKAEGNDPKEVIEQSILSGYSGLFSVNKGKQSNTDQNRAVIEAFKLKLDQQEQQTQGETYDHE